MPVTRSDRSDRSVATRVAILTAAERLMAEHGVHVVSNRQISEAAGQGNTAAVGYHFGTKEDLVRAVVDHHGRAIEAYRAAMVEATGSSDRIADWVGCLVRPVTDHLEALGSPSWFARFAAQVMTDPVLRPIMIEQASEAPALRRAIEGLFACVPQLSPEEFAERNDMMRQLMVHIPAERERALADGTPTPRSSWPDTATGLIAAISGMWQAPRPS